MVFMQIFVSYKSVVYIFVQWKLVWKKIKLSVTSAYIECATGKRYHSIELADSFLLKYRYWTFAKITACERSFERLASLPKAIGAAERNGAGL